MADITLTYKGLQIAETSESGTKTLKTAGKYCEDDIMLTYDRPEGASSSIFVTGLGQTATVTATTPGGAIKTATWQAALSCWYIGNLSELGTYTITATEGTKTKTEELLIDVAGDYTIDWEWVTYLYNLGDECETITGGWNGYTASSSYGSVTKNADNIRINSGLDGSYNSAICNATKVDISGYEKLYITYDMTGGSSNNSIVKFVDSVGADPPGVGERLRLNSGSNVTASLTITSAMASASRYICVTNWGDGSTATVTTVKKIWLE